MKRIIVCMILLLLLANVAEAGLWSNIVLANKTKKAEQLAKNIEAGKNWELAVTKTVCEKTRCFKSMSEINYKLRTAEILKSTDSMVISGGEVTNKFLKENLDKSITVKPDMLVVHLEQGIVKEVEVVDIKTSMQAKRKEQDVAFQNICRSLDIKCTVGYTIPQDKVPSKTGDAICMVLPFIAPPTDIPCLIYTFAN